MAMLFPNDIQKDPRKQARTQPTSASRSRPLLSRALRHLVNSARAKSTGNRVSRFPNFEQPGSRRLVICGVKGGVFFLVF
jgi:hypothetical protein